MKYHDNEVLFSLEGPKKKWVLGEVDTFECVELTAGLEVVKGSYTVKDFSIASGQDPDNHIYSGLKVEFGQDGKMSFRVGRKGSDETAKWFNERVHSDQTTFNHTADKLNFAFLGTLELTLTGGFLQDVKKTFIFEGIAIAQGHAGTSNNWWFGGKCCSHIGGNQVLVKGKVKGGPGVKFRFHRGGNAVNAIGVHLSNFSDTANWMNWISGNTPLNRLVLPGSHDAGMSELHHCYPAVFSEPYTRTQSGSIKKQLKVGTRYFDLRVDYDHGELVTYHRTGKKGCNGQNLEVILDQAYCFLKNHPREFIIFKFSHIRDFSDHDAAITKSKIDKLLNNYSDRLYVNGNDDVNLAYLKLDDVRGKMVLVFDYDEFVSPPNGRFRYENMPVGDSNPPGDVNSNLLVFDDYSNTDCYAQMHDDQIAKWNANGGLGQDSMFLLSWTLTPKGLAPGVTSEGPRIGVGYLAMIANPRLPEVMDQQININGQGKPNIVYVDYLNSQLASVAIMYNSDLWSK